MYTSAFCTAVSIELESRYLLMQMCSSLRGKIHIQTQGEPFYMVMEAFNIFVLSLLSVEMSFLVNKDYT